MAVKLSITGMAKLGNANGLDDLAERLRESDGAQYVILKVFPREDTVTRGVHMKTTTVLVGAAEPMIDIHDIRACKSLMEAATLLRRTGESGDELPYPSGDAQTERFPDETATGNQLYGEAYTDDPPQEEREPDFANL